MNSKTLTVVLLLSAASAAFATDPAGKPGQEIEVRKMERTNPTGPFLNQPFNEKRFWYATHLSLAELREKVAKGDANAFLAAADIGLKDVIPTLEKHSRMEGLQQLYASMALAKLGNRKLFKKYLRQAQNGPPEDRYDGILALSYIGNREAVPAIAPLLDESTASKIEGEKSQIPLPEAAARAIENILPAVAEELQRNGKTLTPNDWLAWWKKNKNGFGAAPSN